MTPLVHDEDMNEMNDLEAGSSLSISCDECSMQRTTACGDCVVTFLVGQDDTDESLVLDLDQARVVRLLGQAGLVPELKYRVAG